MSSSQSANWLIQHYEVLWKSNIENLLSVSLYDSNVLETGDLGKNGKIREGDEYYIITDSDVFPLVFRAKPTHDSDKEEMEGEEEKKKKADLKTILICSKSRGCVEIPRTSLDQQPLQIVLLIPLDPICDNCVFQFFVPNDFDFPGFIKSCKLDGHRCKAVNMSGKGISGEEWESVLQKRQLGSVSKIFVELSFGEEKKTLVFSNTLKMNKFHGLVLGQCISTVKQRSMVREMKNEHNEIVHRIMSDFKKLEDRVVRNERHITSVEAVLKEDVLVVELNPDEMEVRKSYRSLNSMNFFGCTWKVYFMRGAKYFKSSGGGGNENVKEQFEDDDIGIFCWCVAGDKVDHVVSVQMTLLGTEISHTIRNKSFAYTEWGKGDFMKLEELKKYGRQVGSKCLQFLVVLKFLV